MMSARATRNKMLNNPHLKQKKRKKRASLPNTVYTAQIYMIVDYYAYIT